MLKIRIYKFMRLVAIVLQIFFFVFVLVQAGCGPKTEELPTPTDNGSDLLYVYIPYTPTRIDILPLTEFVTSDGVEDTSKLRVYVSLLDYFRCQIKTPGVFRFELYECVPRSGAPKGKRIAIWPDIDLTDAVQNNSYWRDFLRSYEFNLPFQPASGQSYILQATCLCPSGRRLSAQYTLKRTK